MPRKVIEEITALRLADEHITRYAHVLGWNRDKARRDDCYRRLGIWYSIKAKGGRCSEFSDEEWAEIEAVLETEV